MTLSIKDIALILWQRKRMLMVCTILSSVLAFGMVCLIETPLYTASASVYVYNKESRVDYNISTGELSASQRLVSTYIVVLRSDNVLNQVSEKLVNYELSAEEIRNMLSASAIDSTEAFSIAITAEEPQMAQEVCNTILEVAPDEIVRVVKAGSVEIIDRASLPNASTWNISKYILIGAFLGLAGSICYILLRYMFDTTIYDEVMLTEHFDIPVIGIIPAENLQGQRRYGTYNKR